MDLGGSPKMEGQKVTSRKYYEMELQKLNASLLEMGEMIRMAIGGAVTALLEFDHDKARRSSPTTSRLTGRTAKSSSNAIPCSYPSSRWPGICAWFRRR